MAGSLPLRRSYWEKGSPWGNGLTRGSGPTVHSQVSGSEEDRTVHASTAKTPARTTPRAETCVKNGGTPCAPPVLRPPAGAILLFLFWTVHGPFSLFLLEEKEKMGGAMNQPSSWLKSSPPEGRVQSPLWGPAKRDSPFRAVSFFCRKAKSHFTHLTTRRVRPKRPIALGITIRLLNISDSSHTRSLDARVPRKINTRAISV